MKLESQICTLDQAEMLSNLGIDQTCSLVIWHINIFGPYPLFRVENELHNNGFAAFTVAELGVMIPAGYDTMYITGEGWSGLDKDGDHVLKSYNTESQCRAQMLIELIKRKEITPDECNKILLKS